MCNVTTPAERMFFNVCVLFYKFANAIQKIPVVWPAVARATEAILRREQRRKQRG